MTTKRQENQFKRKKIREMQNKKNHRVTKQGHKNGEEKQNDVVKVVLWVWSHFAFTHNESLIPCADTLAGKTSLCRGRPRALTLLCSLINTPLGTPPPTLPPSPLDHVIKNLTKFPRSLCTLSSFSHLEASGEMKIIRRRFCQVRWTMEGNWKVDVIHHEALLILQEHARHSCLKWQPSPVDFWEGCFMKMHESDNRPLKLVRVH